MSTLVSSAVRDGELAMLEDVRPSQADSARNAEAATARLVRTAATIPFRPGTPSMSGWSLLDDEGGLT